MYIYVRFEQPFTCCLISSVPLISVQHFVLHNGRWIDMSVKARLPTSAASFGRTGDHRWAGVLSLAYFSTYHGRRCELK